MTASATRRKGILMTESKFVFNSNDLSKYLVRWMASPDGMIDFMFSPDAPLEECYMSGLRTALFASENWAMEAPVSLMIANEGCVLTSDEARMMQCVLLKTQGGKPVLFEGKILARNLVWQIT